MDTLRARRPTYTPRTGFVWPISDPSLPEDGKKRDGEDESERPSPTPDEAQAIPDTTETEAEAATSKSAPSVGDGKRRQNNMLLFNAMRTTAMHANQSFTLPVTAAEKPAIETPVEGTTRSSPTPAPVVPQRVPTPKSASSAPTPQDIQPAKGLPGAGKKKKKRTCSRSVPSELIENSMVPAGTSVVAPPGQP